MSDVIRKSDLFREFDVNTPDYDLALYLINPDLSDLEGTVPEKYWKLDDDEILEMTQAEKDVVDAEELADNNESTMLELLDRVKKHKRLRDLTWTVSVSGLDMTFNVETMLVNDTVDITPNAGATKYASPCLVYNFVTDEYYIVVFQRINGSYDIPTLDEILIDVLGEFFVVASGTELVEVNSQ